MTNEIKDAFAKYEEAENGYKTTGTAPRYRTPRPKVTRSFNKLVRAIEAEGLPVSDTIAKLMNH
jgi:hypothetical protein